MNIVNGFDIDTPEGATAYLESVGIDVEHCVRKGMAELVDVVGQSEQLVCDSTELDCPYDFTSRCTMGRCDCKPKAN